jgi:hypothetical protein
LLILELKLLLWEQSKSRENISKKSGLNVKIPKKLEEEERYKGTERKIFRCFLSELSWDRLILIIEPKDTRRF